MIGIKSGTQTWSTAAQTSSLKSDGAQSMTPEESTKVLGDQDLGTYLNKIADPNWVDPVKTRRVGNNELDKDAFLKLFLAQLKNQDPTNPMQGHELAAQLAQFTSLEKLNNIDTGIEKMNKHTDPNRSFDALNLIGRGVSGDSSKILRSDTKSRHDITFTLQAPAKEVELSVRNSSGQEIKKLVARDLKPGSNKVTWDGVMEAGAPATEGEYNVVISAKNGAGQKIQAASQFEGKVSGVNFTAEGPVLMVGQQSIKLSDVKKIFDPREIKEEAQQVASKAYAGKDAGQLVSNAGVGGNLENVGMSQDLINKLQKAGAPKDGTENQGPGAAPTVEEQKAERQIQSAASNKNIPVRKR